MKYLHSLQLSSPPLRQLPAHAKIFSRDFRSILQLSDGSEINLIVRKIETTALSRFPATVAAAFIGAQDNPLGLLRSACWMEDMALRSLKGKLNKPPSRLM